MQSDEKMTERGSLLVQSRFASIDIPEDSIRNLSPELLEILLKDKTTGRNILWCTTDYREKGEGFDERDEIISPGVLCGDLTYGNFYKGVTNLVDWKFADAIMFCAIKQSLKRGCS